VSELHVLDVSLNVYAVVAPVKVTEASPAAATAPSIRLVLPVMCVVLVGCVP
jgi:hypothetical protein